MALNQIAISTWYWLALAIVLILAEVFLPGALLVWLGLGAAIVAVISVPFKLTLFVKLLIWAVSSTLLVVLWFKVLRDNDSTRAGRAEATVGYTGTVLRALLPRESGSMRFSRPILGEDVWECECDVSVAKDARVKVVAVTGREGRRLKVTPV